MWKRSIVLLIVIVACQLRSSVAQYSNVAMNVSINVKPEPPANLTVTSRTPTPTPAPAISFNLVDPFRLPDSNCFCAYDRVPNSLTCSPALQNAMSYQIAQGSAPLINLTMTDCTFSNNRLTLPNIGRRNIDQLRLYDINHRDYLVLDASSFGGSSINQLYIVYTYAQPITMLLISNETFSSPAVSGVLRTLYITSCYIITLNRPLSRLTMLESLTLINIYQFSWHDFQQQIVRLPKLRFINIAEDTAVLTNNIFNALSCQEISSQWVFSYRALQTCSCTYLSFLQTVRNLGSYYQCPNSNNAIDFTATACQLNGGEYIVANQITSFCNRCASVQCPNGSVCAEAGGSEPICLSVSRYDYDTIRSRIPLTTFTRQFLLQESQDFLTVNPNKTLELNGFNSVASVLIDSNRNPAPASPSDAHLFHQTFSEMLNRPWASAIYASSAAQPTLWQQLLVSLDGSIKTINESESKFVFYSKPISTMSVRFPPEEASPDTVGWRITDENEIMENVSRLDSVDRTVTSRVFLKLGDRQNNKSRCEPSSTANCTNRFSITSLKSPKLFYNTDRVPEYDVISILAPSSNQSVTFYFDRKVSPAETSTVLTNITSDAFYDQLDQMTTEGTCMYLNTSSMLWQTDGCTTDRQQSSATSVTCTCEHLTMFTVFFSLSCAKPSKALQVLSWIGCVLSIVGLSITLVTFIVIRQCQKTKDPIGGISSSHSSSSQELRRRIMGKPRRLSMVKCMLFILCLLLIAMNILIAVLTFVQSDRNLACTLLSAALYYVTLAAFLWKLCFAFQQSLFITNTLQPHWSDRTLFIIYSIVTFSLPICPLVVMFVKYPNSMFISSTCNYCWLTREFLLYGLVIPILVIICINLVFYIYTMVNLCIRNRQQPNLRSTKSEQSRQMQNFKIGLFFAIIMGFSWILGFLLLIPNSYVQTIGNILFCIVNTLQGFAFSIMVFCMLERKSFRKCCCFWRYKNSSQVTGNSSDAVLQQSRPTSNGANAPRSKPTLNSFLSTSSNPHDAYQNLRDMFNIHSKKKPPTPNGDEPIYNPPSL